MKRKDKIREEKLEKKYGDPLLKDVVDEEDKLSHGFLSISHIYYDEYKRETKKIYFGKVLTIVFYVVSLAWFALYLFTGYVSSAICGLTWLVLATQSGLDVRIDLIHNQRTRESITRFASNKAKNRAMEKDLKRLKESRV